MPFTEQEKVSIRSHLGYLNVQAAATFALGIPAAVETQFIIEGAMDRILDAALPLAREFISHLDTIQAQKVQDLEVLVVDSIGEIDIRKDEQQALDKQYSYWQNKLADLLGVMVNPFSKAHGDAGGLNVSVIH